MKFKIFFITFIFIISIQIYTFATEIDINAESALLVEVSTGQILYEKNSKKQMYPASTTKILTGILVIENSNLSDMVTVSQTALQNIPQGYVTCNLQVGEILSVNDLLHALLIPSANDAAFVLAEYIGGSINEFSNMMNSKALELGCTNTHFVNPNGIHNDNHYSTAYDLYLMADYAMKNETFKNIVCKTKYTLPSTNKYQSEDRVLTTTNELLNKNSRNYYYENAIGVKTGHTTQAGNCLVTKSSKNGLEFISVILNAGKTSTGLNSRYTDSKKLLEYAYNNYTFSNIVHKNSVIDTIEIDNGTKDTKHLEIIINNDIIALHNKNLNFSTITPEIILKENLFAPIDKGSIIGQVKYNIDGTEYFANVLANSNVEKQIDASIILVVIGFILLLISYSILKSKKKRKRKKKQKL